MGYLFIFLFFPLLPALVALWLLVGLLAPRRRRCQYQWIAGGSYLGFWLGAYGATCYNLAGTVRQAHLNAPSTYVLLRGLGFGGSHNGLMWAWNALVLLFWLTLLLGLLGLLAYRGGTRPVRPPAS